MTAHYVYRVYDAEGRLIYVGCAASIFDRLDAHRNSSWWAYQAVRVHGTVHRSRAAALKAESAAIKADRPRWNVKGRTAGIATWTADEFIDYLTALLHLPGPSPARVRHMHMVARRYRTRFGRRIPLELPQHPDGADQDRWLEPMSRSELMSAVREELDERPAEEMAA